MKRKIDDGSIHLILTFSILLFMAGHSRAVVAQTEVDVQVVGVKGSKTMPGPEDLLVQEQLVNDVSPYEPAPGVGESCWLTARIVNNGTEIVQSVEIYFTEQGRSVGTTSVSLLLAGEARNVSIDWVPQHSRRIELAAEVDPNNLIAEEDENNNRHAVLQRIQHERLNTQQWQVLENIARNLPLGEWPGLTTEQEEHLLAKAEEYLSDFREYHMPFGTALDLWYNSRDRNSGIYRYETCGDSATWAGHHLAAEAFRFALTQDAKTLASINRVLDAYDILTRVSGREGYIARCAGPRDDPAYIGYYSVYGGGEDPERPGFGQRAFLGVPPYEDLVWLGNSSRDVYDGVIFGLATTYRLVDDENVRARIATIVDRVIERLESDNWDIVDGKGNVTSGSDNVTGAWLLTGAVTNPPRWRSAWEAHAPNIGVPRGKGKNAPEYFSNNLTFILHYVFCTMEYDPERSSFFRNGMRTVWHDVRDHHNAWFAALYMDATGDIDHSRAKATLEGTLYEYPEPTRWRELRNHLGRTDIEYEVGGRLSQPFVELYAKYPLRVDERLVSDFIWQRNPGATLDLTPFAWAFPGTDLFAPTFLNQYIKQNPGPADAGLVDVVARSIVPETGKAISLTDPFAINQFIPMPDLPEAGLTINLETKIVNRGADPLTDVIVRLYQGNPNEDGLLIGQETVSVLSPHDTVILTFHWLAPLPGEYEIYGVVDPHDEFSETVEANNLFVRQLTVVSANTALDDVSLDELRAFPQQVDVGDPMVLTSTLSNNGPFEIKDLEVDFYQGHPLDGGVLIERNVVDSLQPGQIRDVSIAWQPQVRGRHTIVAIADPDNDLIESDEHNNEQAIEVDVFERFFVDDNDAAVVYAWGWHEEFDLAAIGSTYHRRMGQHSQNRVPTATLEFTGHEISVYYAKSNLGGVARVLIDGTEVDLLDCFLDVPESEGHQPVFNYVATYGELSEGHHTLVIEHINRAVYLDGFEIVSGDSEAGVHSSDEPHSSSQETRQITVGGSNPSAVEFVNVDLDTVDLSINVDGKDHALSVEVIDPLGTVIASGGALLTGSMTSGVDVTTARSGSYTIIISDPLGAQTNTILSLVETRTNP